MLNATFRLFSRLLLISTAVAAQVGAMATDLRAEAEATRLPPSPKIEGDGAALLMIEFVNEWLAPDGALRGLIQDQRQWARSQQAGKRALAAARVAGMPVIHATLQLSPDYRELGRARFGLRGAIPRAGTWQKQNAGWQFHEGFVPLANEFVISGRAGASAFAASDLDNYLRGQGITRLYLAGYATHVCVESTARAAHDLGYEPIVLHDATAAFTAAQQDHVIKEVVHHFGSAISTDAFIAGMGRAVHGEGAPPNGEKDRVPDADGDLRTVTAAGQKIPGVSGAARVPGGLVFLSGHVPLDEEGAVPSSLEAQLEQVFRNLEGTLREAGSGMDRIARMTIYVRDYRPDQLGLIRQVRDRWLAGHAPASALVGVQALFRPDVRVEIDAVAMTR